MLKILLVIKLLCQAPQATAPTCLVQWYKMDNGREAVTISGHHKRDVVACAVIDKKNARCIAVVPKEVQNETPPKAVVSHL